jgi:hypothetical protein
MKKDKTVVDRRTNKIFNIRKVIRNNSCCLICIRRIKGSIKKYKTNC